LRAWRVGPEAVAVVVTAADGGVVGVVNLPGDVTTTAPPQVSDQMSDEVSDLLSDGWNGRTGEAVRE
jgi:hypothetical protein